MRPGQGFNGEAEQGLAEPVPRSRAERFNAGAVPTGVVAGSVLPGPAVLARRVAVTGAATGGAGRASIRSVSAWATAGNDATSAVVR
ncbi:MAG TPA: hypothetical protein VFJ07_17780 [Streptosporangiaceae bacterium]|nr:hypothetical protein [Streptosporangiaceae bacterium]